MPKMKLKKYPNGTGKLKGDTSGTGINPNTRPSYNGQEYSNAKSVVIPKGGATNKYDYDIRRTADGSDYYEPKAAPKVVARTTTPAKPVTPVKTNVNTAPANIKPEYTPGKKTIRIPSSDPRLAHDNKYATYKTVVRDISEEEEDTRLSKNLNVRGTNNGTKVIPTTPSTNVAKLKKGGTIGKYTDGTSTVSTKKYYNSAGQEIQLAKPRPNYGGYIPSNQITARPSGGAALNVKEGGDPNKYGRDLSSYVSLAHRNGVAPKLEKGGVIGKIFKGKKAKDAEARDTKSKELEAKTKEGLAKISAPKVESTKGTGVSFRSEAAEYKPKYDTSKGGTVAVAKYQEKLNKETGSNLKVDGIWGDKTGDAYSKSLKKKVKESKVTAEEIGATEKKPTTKTGKAKPVDNYAGKGASSNTNPRMTPANKKVPALEMAVKDNKYKGMSDKQVQTHGAIGLKNNYRDVVNSASEELTDRKDIGKQDKKNKKEAERSLPSWMKGDTAQDLAERAGRYGDTDDAGFAVGMGAKEGIKKAKEEGSDWKTVAGAVATGIAINYGINKFQKRKGSGSNIPFRGSQIGSSKSVNQKQLGVGGSGKTHYAPASNKQQGRIEGKSANQKQLNAGGSGVTYNLPAKAGEKPRVRVKVGTPPVTPMKAKTSSTKRNSSKNGKAYQNRVVEGLSTNKKIQAHQDRLPTGPSIKELTKNQKSSIKDHKVNVSAENKSARQKQAAINQSVAKNPMSKKQSKAVKRSK